MITPNAVLGAMNKDANGTLYEGEWVGEKHEGRGIQIKDGNRYDGQFVDNQYHGYGRLVKSSGDIYQGQFENGAQSG